MSEFSYEAEAIAISKSIIASYHMLLRCYRRMRSLKHRLLLSRRIILRLGIAK